MDESFRRHPADSAPSEAIAREEPSTGTARASSPPVSTGAEQGSGAEVARLTEELQREQEEKARALAQAELRLVEALAEQRLEMEEEARERLAEVARIQEELARQRAEIQAELSAIRRQRSENESRLAAMVQPSAHVAHG